ncbi:DUF2975 domain-containing protein [Cellulomonas telluris]|uniref:DUF2975 domain-containing protein n=1 Tax=Cellulomonas telluris TaxID=2306636 RepID=UPI0010A85AD0|nr:DUF2975 domain-containing protein [Cellulomonas telluris]
MSRLVFNILTLLIFFGIAVALFAQAVILPGIAADEVRHFPPYEPYRVPLLTAGIAFIACAQVSLAAVWMLVLRAQAGTFFRPGTQRWVVTIGAAVGAATMLTSGFFLYLTFLGIPTPDDEDMGELGLWMVSGLGSLIGVALLGVVFVTHRLVTRATEAQTELDGVL